MKVTKDTDKKRDFGPSWYYEERTNRLNRVAFYFTEINNNCKLLFCTNINSFNETTAKVFDNAISKSNRVVVQMVFTSSENLKMFERIYSKWIVFQKKIQIGYTKGYQYFVLMLNPYSTYDGSYQLRKNLKIDE